MFFLAVNYYIIKMSILVSSFKCILEIMRGGGMIWSVKGDISVRFIDILLGDFCSAFYAFFVFFVVQTISFGLRPNH